MMCETDISLVPVQDAGKKHPVASLVVIAYNHLDYTRQCIESIYKYTSHIDFELITINNGSTDGTEEYFKSLPNQKKISFPQNMGVCKAINQGFLMAEGKYTLNISNDIVVTTRWLDNLLTCMETDEKIGMVVPVCNATCNYQHIDVSYDTMEQMQEFAKSFNKSDPHKWEERLKLSTYLGIYRTDLQKALHGFDEAFNPGCYDDDAMCFNIRRMGYKVILARDTFVHHYGAKTFNAEYVKDRSLAYRNKALFIRKFGVDPFVAGLMDTNVLELFSYTGASGKNILAIGSSYGGTALQVKNLCRYFGADDVRLYYVSDQLANMRDLKTICDGCAFCPISEMENHLGKRTYDYILLESVTHTLKDWKDAVTSLYKLLNPGGQFVCTAANGEVFRELIMLMLDAGADLKKHYRGYYLLFQKPE